MNVMVLNTISDLCAIYCEDLSGNYLFCMSTHWYLLWNLFLPTTIAWRNMLCYLYQTSTWGFKFFPLVPCEETWLGFGKNSLLVGFWIELKREWATSTLTYGEKREKRGGLHYFFPVTEFRVTYFMSCSVLIGLLGMGSQFEVEWKWQMSLWLPPWPLSIKTSSFSSPRLWGGIQWPRK